MRAQREKSLSVGRFGRDDGGAQGFDALTQAVRACRVCRDQPRYGAPLDHEPKPILQVARSARICIASQAPGIRAHQSGRPFTDPSGDRLRHWLGVDDAEFYDESKIAIVPMGFCFPGLTPGGSDRAPRRECAELWRRQLFEWLPELQLMLIIGGYAQRWHLGREQSVQGVDATVRQWRSVYQARPGLLRLPLPHPSWRNSGWLKRNPWFEAELLPVLRHDVRRILA